MERLYMQKAHPSLFPIAYIKYEELCLTICPVFWWKAGSWHLFVNVCVRHVTRVLYARYIHHLFQWLCDITFDSISLWKHWAMQLLNWFKKSNTKDCVYIWKISFTTLSVVRSRVCIFPLMFLMSTTWRKLCKRAEATRQNLVGLNLILALVLFKIIYHMHLIWG